MTVSTPALAGRFAPHGRVAVVPNCVPASYLSEPNRRIFAGRDWQPGTKVRVGWSGSVETHPGDLEATGGALGTVLGELGGVASCHVIGTGKGVKDALRLGAEPSSTGWLPLEHYPQGARAARRRHRPVAGVRVQPGQVVAEGSGDGGVRGAVRRVPAARVRAAGDPRRRCARLRRPPVDRRSYGRSSPAPTLRAEHAAKGRAVAKHYTIEANAHRWWEAWTSAAEMRRAA